MSNMFVPQKINVGFQKRSGTYTGKLAYIIYWDAKGKLRKERSWQTWRSNDIEPQAFKNEPTEGFVLNKGVGGKRYSWGRNTRNEYIRIYDPRDFEFEISVANLLFILRECSCSKGKGLEGKFVYAWDGTELVLLPEGCEEYTECMNFTSLQAQRVSARDLKPGHVYMNKNAKELIYVGRLPKYMPCVNNNDTNIYRGSKEFRKNWNKKYHVFYRRPNEHYPRGQFEFLSAIPSSIAREVGGTHVQDFPEIHDKYLNSEWGSPFVELKLGPWSSGSSSYEQYYGLEHNGSFFTAIQHNYVHRDRGASMVTSECYQGWNRKTIPSGPDGPLFTKQGLSKALREFGKEQKLSGYGRNESRWTHEIGYKKREVGYQVSLDNGALVYTPAEGYSISVTDQEEWDKLPDALKIAHRTNMTQKYNYRHKNCQSRSCPEHTWDDRDQSLIVVNERGKEFVVQSYGITERKSDGEESS